MSWGLSELAVYVSIAFKNRSESIWENRAEIFTKRNTYTLELKSW